MGKGSQRTHDLLIEKDIEIPVRDGARLKADIFRPKAGGRFPVIMNIGGYRKDKVWVPPLDLEEKANPYMNSADYNVGDNTVFTGGSMASYLLLPVILKN